MPVPPPDIPDRDIDRPKQMDEEPVRAVTARRVIGRLTIAPPRRPADHARERRIALVMPVVLQVADAKSRPGNESSGGGPSRSFG